MSSEWKDIAVCISCCDKLGTVEDWASETVFIQSVGGVKATEIQFSPTVMIALTKRKYF